MRQDLVLPVLIWEKFNVLGLDVTNAKTHREKGDSFNTEFFNLSSTENTVLRDQLIVVVHTVLAQLCTTIPSLKWTADVLPLSHDHPYKYMTKQKSEIHVECTINLSEMETDNMVEILAILQWKYLCLLHQRLPEEEKEQYSQALRMIRQEGVGVDELRAAEAVVDRVVHRFGRLILWDDQLTIKNVHIAITSRKLDWTKFEKFEYIMVTRLGDLHIMMALVCKNFKALMPQKTSRNPCTFGSFAGDLARAHKIFNEEKKHQEVR